MAVFILPSGERRPGIPNLLGRGVAYPLRRSSTGGIQMAEDEELVRMSVRFLLDTDPMEQPFDVRNGVPLGVGLHHRIFGDLQHVKELGTYLIRKVLETWEPRIEVRRVDVTAPTDATSEGLRTVRFVVGYEIRATGRVDNAVVDVPVRSSL